MNEANQGKKDNKKPQEKTINYWKWAFIILITGLLLFSFLLIQSLRPVTRSDDTVSIPISKQKDEIEIRSSLSKEDASFILNSFLEEELDNEQLSSEIRIEDDVQLSSTIDWMGLTIPFELIFEPYATEEGNLQFRAQAVELASLSLPVDVLMAALGNQMTLPSYIQLDSDAQTVFVDFNALREIYPYGIEIIKIDLPEDEIQLKLFVNKDTLKRGLGTNRGEKNE